MKTITSKLTVTFFVIALALGVIAVQDHYFSESTSAHLLLLLPDSADTESPKVQVWLDAIEEEGFLVSVMRDSEFLRPWTNRALFAGVILPDQVHKEASDSLISTLGNYVENGGKLMLVYDAGIWSLKGRYSSDRSRFSALAGVNYAQYNTLQEKTTSWQPVLASAQTLTALRFPPGKFHPYNMLVAQSGKKFPAIDTTKTQVDKTHSVSGYGTALINYDIYQTSGQYNGEILLQSPRGDIIAGQRQHGKGTVLYINLSLGYLKGRTDGLFLHSFLHYFANKIVQLPYLASVPAGIGGIVMNWHLDANVAFKSLKSIRDTGIYNQGPYSIHITAGPDAHFVGDKAGLNVPGNKRIQNWIKDFKEKGYAVGSHGGWIHDRFGLHLTKETSKEFENYLAKNKKALEKVVSKPVTEYSSPEGNHPEWITDWLSKNGINAYYFTGNTGMAPTRSYRQGVLQHENVWSFPILPYRAMAGLEEFQDYKIKPRLVKNWLNLTSEFVANTYTTRLIYFHPRGALHYKSAIRSWLDKADKLQRQKRFRWYTMSEVATFLTTRTRVQWDFIVNQDIHSFSANHPENLNNMTWLLSADVYDKPGITEGKAIVNKSNNQWRIIAGNGKKLIFTAKKLNNDE